MTPLYNDDNNEDDNDDGDGIDNRQFMGLHGIMSSNKPTRKRVGWVREREITNECTLALQGRSFDFDFLSLSPLVLVPFSCGKLLLIC